MPGPDTLDDIKGKLETIEKALNESQKFQGDILEGLKFTPVLEGQGELKKSFENFKKDLEEGQKNALTEAERLEFNRKLEVLAGSLPIVADNIFDIIRCAKSGEPYALSASVMDLCGSLTSMVQTFVPPPFNVGVALVGSLFSIVSSILKYFIPEPPSLTEQIETLLRQIEAEKQQQTLLAARTAIRNFLRLAATTKEIWKFEEMCWLLSPNEGNTITGMRLADQWLLEPKNQRLDLWKEVLDIRLNNLMMLKVGLSNWLKAVRPEDLQKVLEAYSCGDTEDLEFLKRIKEPARSRGTLWCIGVPETIYVSDCPVQGFTRFKETNKCRVMAVSNQHGQAVANPCVSVFTFEFGTEDESFPEGVDSSLFLKIPNPSPAPGSWYDRALHPFRRKGRAYGLSGKWPLAERQWKEIPQFKGLYDIWATRGDSNGAVRVYTADGSNITCHKQISGQELKFEQKFELPAGYKVGSVRAACLPQPSKAQSGSLLNKLEWAVYGLCEVGANKGKVGADPVKQSEHFEIQANFSDGQVSYVLPPFDSEWENHGHKAPWACVRGIAIDSVRLWVFRAGEIAYAPHTDVKNSDKTTGEVTWVTYKIPTTVGNYDPSQKLFHGVHDLSPCDDGTLTIVVDESLDGRPNEPRQRMCTGTMRFGDSSLTVSDWAMDKLTEVRQAMKQPIYCWPMLDALADLFQPKALKGSAVSPDTIGPQMSGTFNLGRFVEQLRTSTPS